VRYLFYLLFIVAASTFWLFVAVFILGLLSGEPACRVENAPCPEPNLLVWTLESLVILSALPITVFAFVLYRRAIHRWFGLDID
jgi:hypothetical protein